MATRTPRQTAPVKFWYARRVNMLAATPRPASFWHFVGAVSAGNVAAFGAAYLTRKVMEDTASDDKRNLAAAFVGLGTFWLVGGLTWALISAD